MARKQYSAEQIIGMPREAEIKLATGQEQTLATQERRPQKRVSDVACLNVFTLLVAA